MNASARTPRIAALLDGPADIVLIDTQLDRNGALSSLGSQAHDFLMVTRVAASAITEAYACMKRLHYAHAIPQFRVLINHVQNPADVAIAFENLVGRCQPVSGCVARAGRLCVRGCARRSG